MKIKLLATLILCFCANSTFANKAQTEFLQIIDSIKTYEASFEQVIQDDSGRVINQSKGLMIVKRPNQFYWQTNAPDPIKVIADGKTLWSYDIDLEQVTKQDLTKAIKNSPASILAGDIKEFSNNFVVAHAPKQSCKKGDGCYSLTSTDLEPVFTNMVMSMDKNKLLEIHMTDQMGQHVFTRFSNIKVNGNIDANKFQFTLPKGVDVVEMSKD